MHLFKRFSMLVFVILVCLSCVVPAYASGGSGGATSGIDISVGPNGGVTIKPGDFPNMANGNLDQIQDEASEKIVSKSKTVAQTITAVCAIIAFVSFIINIVKLSTAGSSPFIRRAALIGLLWSGIALSLFGGSFVVVSFFWNFFK